MDTLPEDVAEVWWAHLPGLSEVGRAELDALLDPVEKERHAAYRRQSDRDRFALGTGIIRRACAHYLGREAASIDLDRTCSGCSRPHGKVRLSGGGPRFSVSHSGEWVGVAFARDAEVGLDVEQVRALDVAAMASGVLTPAEAQQILGRPDDVAGFVRSWTRKEAVVKATADGLMTPLNELEVTGPNQAPAVLSWKERADLIGRVQLHDLAGPLPGAAEFAPDHLASLAILSERSFHICELDATSMW